MTSWTREDLDAPPDAITFPLGQRVSVAVGGTEVPGRALDGTMLVSLRDVPEDARGEVINIGRAEGGDAHMANTDPGTRGWIGNPFRVDESERYGRLNAVIRFRNAFRERVRSDDRFHERVGNLSGNVLACWCVPRLCHGDIILAYLSDSEDAINGDVDEPLTDGAAEVTDAEDTRQAALDGSHQSGLADWS